MKLQLLLLLVCALVAVEDAAANLPVAEMPAASPGAVGLEDVSGSTLIEDAGAVEEWQERWLDRRWGDPKYFGRHYWPSSRGWPRLRRYGW